MLRDLHAAVAELCVKLGAEPSEVPCDIWHLAGQIEQLQRDVLQLATSWDLVGRGAREGWDERRLAATDAARDRALYPNRDPSPTQLPLPEVKKP
jgi:hypothetical protein